VVATVICGDDYFVEKGTMEEVSGEIIQLIKPYRPDVMIAGPAFDAGRYGIACGALCKAAQDQLGITAVTGMYKENPGLDLFRKDVYVVQTTETARGMAEAISKMVTIAGKLADSRKLGKPAEEGYFPRGFIVNEISDKTGAERAVSMLLSKLRGQPFESEVPIPKYDRVAPAPSIKDSGSLIIALATDGGLVPKGNPDRIESRHATRFGSYDIKNMNALNPEDYEINHGGYNPLFVTEDPNRLVPVDVMRQLVKEGVIERLHEKFYSTSGLANIVENTKRIGRAMAEKLKIEEVSGVILTST
jgi:glycine reductase